MAGDIRQEGLGPDSNVFQNGPAVRRPAEPTGRTDLTLGRRPQTADDVLPLHFSFSRSTKMVSAALSGSKIFFRCDGAVIRSPSQEETFALSIRAGLDGFRETQQLTTAGLLAGPVIGATNDK